MCTSNLNMYFLESNLYNFQSNLSMDLEDINCENINFDSFKLYKYTYFDSVKIV